MTAQRLDRPRSIAIRPVAWLLIAGAIVAAGLNAAGRGLLAGAFALQPIAVADVMGSATGLALAAAIVIGANRWPAGRAWLLGAAISFGLSGVLELVLQVWFTSFQANPRVLSDIETVGLVGRAFVGLGALAIGAGLAAIGLWRGRPRTDWRRADPIVIATIGVLGAIAVAGSIGIVVRDVPTSPIPPVTIVDSMLLAIVALTTAGLAAAASRYRPFGHHLPELAILTGALLYLVMTATRPWTLLLIPLDGTAFEGSAFLFGVPLLLGAIGTVVMVIGFGSGRPREAQPPI